MLDFIHSDDEDALNIDNIIEIHRIVLKIIFQNRRCNSVDSSEDQISSKFIKLIKNNAQKVRPLISPIAMMKMPLIVMISSVLIKFH